MIRSRIQIVVPVLAFSALMAQAAPQSYDVNDCFLASIKTSELIGTQTELINQAEEKYNQAKAAIFPTINGVGTYQIQQSPPASASTSSPAEQVTAKLTATQPLFHGMREYAAISQMNLQVTAQISAKRQAAAQLYSDVASNFYTILSFEQILRDFQSEIDVHEQRIKDLKSRVNIGRSKTSEVLTEQSIVDTTAAQVAITRGQLLAAREALAFLTGFDRNAKLLESNPLSTKPNKLDSYLTQIEDRPDVKSASDNLKSVEKSVDIARGGHLPSIDLSSDYYFKRPGVTSAVHWDVLITATIPLFAGGAVDSQVRQAVSLARQNDLALERTRRLADQEIRTNYSNLVSDIDQVEKLERATQSAFENYKAQSHDYKLGLVTNLDVLQAITSSQQSQRALDTAKFQEKLDFVKLETSAAIRPNPSFLRSVSQLDSFYSTNFKMAEAK